MGISLDGLASGLDTTALISSMMQVEAIPQTLLKNKSSGIQSMVSALQGLNSKVAALATQATAAAKPGALDLYPRPRAATRWLPRRLQPPQLGRLTSR